MRQPKAKFVRTGTKEMKNIQTNLKIEKMIYVQQ